MASDIPRPKFAYLFTYILGVCVRVPCGFGRREVPCDIEHKSCENRDVRAPISVISGRKCCPLSSGSRRSSSNISAYVHTYTYIYRHVFQYKHMQSTPNALFKICVFSFVYRAWKENHIVKLSTTRTTTAIIITPNLVFGFFKFTISVERWYEVNISAFAFDFKPKYYFVGSQYKQQAKLGRW